MMSMKRVIGGLALGALLSLASAPESFAAMSTEQRLADFNQLVSIFQRNYAPLRWKKQSVELDFAAHVNDFRGKVAVARSDAEFYQLLSRFCAGFKDGHVTALTPSTYRANLPFTVDLIEGKVLIETVDRLRLPEPLFPFKKGDQLVSFDGVPAEQMAHKLNEISNTGHLPGSLRIAAARITSRRQDRGFTVPKGTAMVTVLPKGASEPVTVTATWIIAGTPFLELDDLENFTDEDVSAVPTAADGKQFLKQIQKLPQFNASLSANVIAELRQAGITDIGSPKSMFKLPDGAKEVPGSPVTSAIYEVGSKKIGILRIPQYGNDGLLEVLARNIQIMEKNTDALVIDQTNNPGGNVALVSAVIGLFATKTYKDIDFRLRPSHKWLAMFQSANMRLEEMIKRNPNDFTANALKPRFEFLEGEVRDAIREKRYLTKPVSLILEGSFGVIQPNTTVRYTKPVLVLINEFDFSGGDMFPAIMKDNGRVTLFGSQTTGAGGNVAEHGPLAHSGFKLQLTESLMVRPNGEFIENRGVKPDVAYEVTEDDFMNGYRGYVKAFTVEALKLAGATQEEIDAYKAK